MYKMNMCIECKYVHVIQQITVNQVFQIGGNHQPCFPTMHTAVNPQLHSHLISIYIKTHNIYMANLSNEQFYRICQQSQMFLQVVYSCALLFIPPIDNPFHITLPVKASLDHYNRAKECLVDALSSPSYVSVVSITHLAFCAFSTSILPRTWSEKTGPQFCRHCSGYRP